MNDQTRRDGAEALVLPGSRSPHGPDRIVPIGRHGHPKEEIGNIHQARLIDAFVEVVGRVGYDGARISEISRKAGVSNGVFYSRFTNKEDCYVTAFDIGARQLVERAKAAYDAAVGPWEDRVRAGIEAILVCLAANPSFARLCAVNTVRVGPVAVEHANAVIDNLRRAFDAHGQPEVPPALEGAPMDAVLTGALTRPVFTYVKKGKTDQLPELTPCLAYFLTLLTLGPERAARQVGTA